ncbi:MAG: hypothetical protein M3252_05250 [Actinomycetota bacterium]|nr:hypothetical protein [Actinomycetota bacterium]
MDLKTIITMAPFVRRIYRRLPRPLRIFAILLAVVVGVVKLMRGRDEAPTADSSRDVNTQSGEQTG